MRMLYSNALEISFLGGEDGGQGMTKGEGEKQRMEDSFFMSLTVRLMALFWTETASEDKVGKYEWLPTVSRVCEEPT
jgi:hypothetical protein